MDKLKPCPFCGGEVSLVLCDDEGNLHDEAYREHPYSGLGFMLHHAHEENLGCPIASYECDGGILGGVYIYDTEEQAVEAWNRRVNDGKDTKEAETTQIIDGCCTACGAFMDCCEAAEYKYCPYCAKRIV